MRLRRSRRGMPKAAPKKKPKASPLDKLPPALQLVGESLIESQSRPVPPEAAAEFPRLRDEIARIDDGARSATVTADSELLCYGLTSWEFRPLVESNASIAWKLLETMAKRLRSAQSN